MVEKQEYTGEFADFLSCITVPNNAEPFDTDAARKFMAETRDEFYESHFSVLDAIAAEKKGWKPNK